MHNTFSAKKNEYTKIAVPLTGSKGQALRVLGTISTPPLGRVVFCPKTLTAAALWLFEEYILFFFFSFFFLFSGGKNYLQGVVPRLLTL